MQPLQEGSEAHARGLPLLGAIHAACLPEQGVPSLAASAPGGKCPAAQALIQTSWHRHLVYLRS